MINHSGVNKGSTLKTRPRTQILAPRPRTPSSKSERTVDRIWPIPNSNLHILNYSDKYWWDPRGKIMARTSSIIMQSWKSKDALWCDARKCDVFTLFLCYRQDGRKAPTYMPVLFLHGPIIRFFAQQGRHVAPISVKFGREEERTAGCNFNLTVIGKT